METERSPRPTMNLVSMSPSGNPQMGSLVSRRTEI